MSHRDDRLPHQPRMCGTCHLVLTPVEFEGQVVWSHGHPVDHETVVGPLVDPEFRCDFCSDLNPTWNAECTPFLVEASPFGMEIAAQDDGAWAACDACASYIRRNDWPRLLYRATKAFTWPPGMPEPGRLIALMHDQFRQHYTGTITPLR